MSFINTTLNPAKLCQWRTEFISISGDVYTLRCKFCQRKIQSPSSPEKTYCVCELPWNNGIIGLIYRSLTKYLVGNLIWNTFEKIGIHSLLKDKNEPSTCGCKSCSKRRTKLNIWQINSVKHLCKFLVFVFCKRKKI